MNWLLAVLIFAYAASGVVGVIGYLPTIKDLWYHKKMSSNNSSYVIWTLTGLVGFLYSLFVLPDLLFQIVSGLNFLCCAIILLLGIILNSRR